ncbi:MAG: RcnB family protein [Sphingorhabdus sp.]
MNKFLLAGMVSTIAFIPAAHAAPSSLADLSLEASADFKRGEGRKGERVRGQGPVSKDAPAGQGERDWREPRASADAPRSERRADRRGGWSQEQQQGQTQGQAQGQAQGRSWNRGEERRERDDDYRRRNDGDWNRGDDWNRGGDDRRWNGRDDDYRRDGRWDGRRDDDRRWSDNRRYEGRERWNRDWRSDRRYDWRGHRERYRSYYRPGRYYAPYRDYRYRRFSIGIHIGSPFYSSRYWIADPWYYRLPPAYGPYRWVRYYDDVLLVDVRNGYVVDVIHDFFW